LHVTRHSLLIFNSTCINSLFFCLSYSCIRALHSFPTRRSSDLSRTYARHLKRPRCRLQAALRRGLRVLRGQPICGPKNSKTPAKDRKSTRLNSSHVSISYAVFCLKKKKKKKTTHKSTSNSIYNK